MVESSSQLQGLIANGYYHDKRWDTPVTPSNKVISSPFPPRKKTEDKKPAPKTDFIIDIDDARWYVGETIQMQSSSDSSVRYTVKLIGFIKGKSLLLTAPTIDGKYVMIRDDQSFILRAFPGKKAYAFTSSAVKSVYSPHPYLHMTYPKQVRCTVIRQGARASVKIIAAVHLSNPERTTAATITDLSLGGCSLILKNSVGEKDDTGAIKFKITVLDTDEFLSVDFTLRSVTLSENGDGYRYGFEFTSMTQQIRLLLAAFVYQTIAEAD